MISVGAVLLRLCQRRVEVLTRFVRPLERERGAGDPANA